MASTRFERPRWLEFMWNTNDFCRFRIKIQKAFDAANNKKQFLSSLATLGTTKTSGFEFRHLSRPIVKNFGEYNSINENTKLGVQYGTTINYFNEIPSTSPEPEIIRLHYTGLQEESDHNQREFPPSIHRLPESPSLIQSVSYVKPRAMNIRSFSALHLVGGSLIAPKEEQITTSGNKRVNRKESSRNIRMKNNFPTYSRQTHSYVPTDRVVPNHFKPMTIKNEYHCYFHQESSANVEEALMNGHCSQSHNTLNFNRIWHPKHFDIKFQEFPKRNDQTYKCHICSMTFSKLSNLKVHLKIHKNNKPFKCDECKKAFNQSSQLATHKLTHIDSKPFECNICYKRFPRAHGLKLHLMYHCPEEPFW